MSESSLFDKVNGKGELCLNARLLQSRFIQTRQAVKGHACPNASLFDRQAGSQMSECEVIRQERKACRIEYSTGNGSECLNARYSTSNERFRTVFRQASGKPDSMRG